MRFSQRIGKREYKTELEKEGLSPELKNSLWTLVLELIIEERSNEKRYEKHSDLTVFFRELWIYFYKWPIDNLPMSYGTVTDYEATPTVRKWFFKSDWDLVLDFIEFASDYHPEFCKICNLFLKKEMSAYRFVDGKITEINSKEEVIEIERALNNSDKFKSVKTHLKTAIELLSDRKNPDFRNSIKESISSVESLAKIITDNSKTTLGQALKEIEKKHNIPKSLKSAFSSLYGYTSDTGGIRHSLLESDVKVDLEEARFMLVTCSAFVNYLMNKIE
ncbi:hypothetical protein JM80_1137 [Cellulophaga sp. RHA_52]|uniref:AbiJ-NTD4 domain-containing protein n=1 Tax=Cellulophaga sp. RHA_52 TaxID=1250036 RepID=UPI00119BA223|nr:hypothetical protein [Cellulophaga sp. RHA_52]TVZ08638.1 hypothetical protein JM80_1137 [Cellulophaga sp. RHA_52]